MKILVPRRALVLTACLATLVSWSACGGSEQEPQTCRPGLGPDDDWGRQLFS